MSPEVHVNSKISNLNNINQNNSTKSFTRDDNYYKNCLQECKNFIHLYLLKLCISQTSFHTSKLLLTLWILWSLWQELSSNLRMIKIKLFRWTFHRWHFAWWVEISCSLIKTHFIITGRFLWCDWNVAVSYPFQYNLLAGSSYM